MECLYEPKPNPYLSNLTIFHPKCVNQQIILSVQPDPKIPDSNSLLARTSKPYCQETNKLFFFPLFCPSYYLSLFVSISKKICKEVIGLSFLESIKKKYSGVLIFYYTFFQIQAKFFHVGRTSIIFEHPKHLSSTAVTDA